jgi:hypothetical protein
MPLPAWPGGLPWILVDSPRLFLGGGALGIELRPLEPHSTTFVFCFLQRVLRFCPGDLNLQPTSTGLIAGITGVPQA